MRSYTRGEKIGPYTVVATLPRGGMGVVYVVRPRPGYNGPPLVVLKMANKEHNDFLKYEIEQMQRLDHPNLLKALPIATHTASGARNRPVFDAKVDPNSSDSPYYIVVEYMRGGSLEQLLKLHGRLNPAAAIAIGLQVAAGLVHIHAHNSVHLDIKDSNILLRAPLSRWRAQQPNIVISDFGIAWSVERKPLGLVYGSQYFTAPERAAGEPPHPRNDLFSLGALLYQLVVGTPPGASSTAPPGTPLEPRLYPAQLNPAVTPAFEQVILRALASDPRDRYQRAQQLATDLEQLAQRDQPGKIRLPLLQRRRDYLLAGCGALAPALLVAFGVATTPAAPAPIVPTVTTTSATVSVRIAATDRPITATALPSATRAPTATATATVAATSTLIPSRTPTTLPPTLTPAPTVRVAATPRAVATRRVVATQITSVQPVQVPDTRGLDVGGARDRLVGAGFQVIAEEEYGPDVASVCNGWVAYSTPPHGSFVAPGSTIRLHYRSFNLPNNPNCA